MILQDPNFPYFPTQIVLIPCQQNIKSELSPSIWPATRPQCISMARATYYGRRNKRWSIFPTFSKDQAWQKLVGDLQLSQGAPGMASRLSLEGRWAMAVPTSAWQRKAREDVIALHDKPTKMEIRTSRQKTRQRRRCTSTLHKDKGAWTMSPKLWWGGCLACITSIYVMYVMYVGYSPNLPPRWVKHCWLSYRRAAYTSVVEN